MTNLHLTPHHVAISVRDIDVSVKFYEILGFKKIHYFSTDNTETKIVHLKLGTLFLEIFEFISNKNSKNYSWNKSGEDSIGTKHLALRTSNIQKSLDQMIELGLADSKTEIIEGRTELQYFFIRDPDGLWVEIVEDNRGY